MNELVSATDNALGTRAVTATSTFMRENDALHCAQVCKAERHNHVSQSHEKGTGGTLTCTL